MRNISRLVVAAALAVSGAAPSIAADLDFTGRPALFGCGEPWATEDERPPRIGRWFYAEPVSPTVNWIVPCHASLARPAPWTPAWYDYCQRKWPSFNPRSGTVETPDGPRRCV